MRVVRAAFIVLPLREMVKVWGSFDPFAISYGEKTSCYRLTSETAIFGILTRKTTRQPIHHCGGGE